MSYRFRDLDLRYEEVGGGLPVLMLHGLFGDHSALRSALEPLFGRREGFRRLYLDLPGMGRTPPRRWAASSEALLDLLCALVDDLLGGGPLLVVGAAYGGYLARGLLYRRGERIDGAMLIGPVVHADPARRRLPSQRVLVSDAALRRTLPPALRWQLDALSTVHTPEVIRRVQNEVMLPYGQADHDFIAELQALDPPRYPFPFEADLDRRPYARPSLIVVGRQDAVVGYRDAFDLHAAFPRATYAALDRAGQVLTIEQTPLLTALADEWLDRVVEARRPRSDALRS